MGPINPAKGEKPNFSQIYIHDSEEAEVDRRMEVSGGTDGKSGVKRDTMKKLQDMMHEHNPLAKSYKSVSKLPKEVIAEKQFVLHGDKKPSDAHNRKYNLPQANEIALIALNDSTAPSDIIVTRMDNTLKRISENNRLFDPLHYVLLLPRAEPGWHHQMKQSNGKTISPMQFYGYKLQVRENNFNTILRGGKLTQEYLCGQWYKIEKCRLDWIDNNQDQVRAEKYCGMIDAITNNDDLSKIGQQIILPPSHHGSPRWYNEQFQNAMATVR